MDTSAAALMISVMIFWLMCLAVFATVLLIARSISRDGGRDRTRHGGRPTGHTDFTAYQPDLSVIDYGQYAQADSGSSSYSDPSPTAESGLNYLPPVCEPGSYYEPAAHSCVPADYGSSYDAGGCGAGYSDSGGSGYSDSCSGSSSD